MKLRFNKVKFKNLCAELLVGAIWWLVAVLVIGHELAVPENIKSRVDAKQIFVVHLRTNVQII